MTQLSVINSGPPLHSPSGGKSNAATALFVLAVLRRWWKVSFPVGILLAFGVAAIVWFTFEPEYFAQATLRIDSKYGAVTEQKTTPEFIQTQLQLLRHRVILDAARGRVAKLPEIKEAADAIQWLQRKLVVRPRGRSELYDVSYRSDRPESAMEIVNSVVDCYMAFLSDMEKAHSSAHLATLNEQQLSRQSLLKSTRNEVRRLEIDGFGKDPFAPDEETSDKLVALQEIQRQMVSAEVEMAVAAAQLEAMEALDTQHPVEIPDWQVDAEVSRSQAIHSAEAALSDKVMKLGEIERRAVRGKNDPLYIQLKKEVEQDRATIDKMAETLRASILEGMTKHVSQERQRQLEEVRLKKNSYATVYESLKAQYTRQQGAVQQLAGTTFDLEIARADLERQQKVYDQIAVKIEQVKTEMDEGLKRVHLLDRAQLPMVPVADMPMMKMVAGGALGFCLPFGLALLWEVRLKRINHRRELQPNLPVLAEIAALPRRRLGSKRSTRDLRVFEESIDSLRTCLLLAQAFLDRQVLAVASAVSGEGKTSLSAQLSVSVARATGQRVLLIDADLRSPQLHEVFEEDGESGLAQVLDDEAELDDVIKRTQSRGVDLLPAGILNRNPHELFNSPRWNEVLEIARENYRYIVIDTPPILAASETLVITKAADAALLCTLRDVSRVDQIQRASERLEMAGANLVGAVVSGVPTGYYKYTYGEYSYG